MLGSQALCGDIDADWIGKAVDDNGVRLADATRFQGLDPTADVARYPLSMAVFLELHAEQGPVLERAGGQIGVVDAVSGVFNWSIALSREANHLDSTLIDLRRDAFRALTDFGAAIGAILEAVGGPDTRLTVGKVDLRPNFPHSIAGEAICR